MTDIVVQVAVALAVLLTLVTVLFGSEWLYSRTAMQPRRGTPAEDRSAGTAWVTSAGGRRSA